MSSSASGKSMSLRIAEWRNSLEPQAKMGHPDLKALSTLHKLRRWPLSAGLLLLLCSLLCMVAMLQLQAYPSFLRAGAGTGCCKYDSSHLRARWIAENSRGVHGWVLRVQLP
jgi:hypothetical protein